MPDNPCAGAGVCLSARLPIGVGIVTTAAFDDVEFVVKAYPQTMTAAVLGTDEQGRTIILCPIHHDEAYVEPDGRVVCPTQDALDAFLVSATDGMRDSGFIA